MDTNSDFESIFVPKIDFWIQFKPTIQGLQILFTKISKPDFKNQILSKNHQKNFGQYPKIDFVKFLDLFLRQNVPIF